MLPEKPCAKLLPAVLSPAIAGECYALSGEVALQAALARGLVSDSGALVPLLCQKYRLVWHCDLYVPHSGRRWLYKLSH